MQLEQRVEVHELDARYLIDLLAAEYAREVVAHGLKRVRVAVGQRIAQQGAVAAYAHEVDAPRVDADALDGDAAPGHSLQSANRLAVEAEDVPVEVASRLDERIVEARQFLHLQLSVGQCGQDGSSAGGSQVDGKEIL